MGKHEVSIVGGFKTQYLVDFLMWDGCVCIQMRQSHH